MQSTKASELGYTKDQVVDFYEKVSLSLYNTLCNSSKIGYQSLRQTGNGLMGSKWTQSAGLQLLSQAKVAEAESNRLIETYKADYLESVQNIIKNWDTSKIIFQSLKGEQKYYQVPYLCGINFINGLTSINFMGKNYSITEVDYETAISIQPECDWDSPISGSSTSSMFNVIIGNGNIIGNSNIVSFGDNMNITMNL